MRLIAVKYNVVRDGESILKSYAEVELTDEDIREVTKFIRDNHFSGELCDVPGHVYDRIQNRVKGAAYDELKAELHDELSESDEVIIQSVLPISLINLLPDDVIDLIDKKKIRNYYSLLFDSDDEEDDCLVYIAEENYWRAKDEGGPRKENTLNLSVKQIDLDQIVSGEKTIVCREIKPSTYKHFLECDEMGIPLGDCDESSEDYDEQESNIYVWNDGIYPFIPRVNLHYLKLVARNKRGRDTALVELDGLKFSPIVDDNGEPMRFIETEDGHELTQKGTFCFWNVEFHIRRVVKVDRAGEG